MLLGKPLCLLFMPSPTLSNKRKTGVQELVALMWLRESKAEVLRIRPHPYRHPFPSEEQ